MRRKYPICDNCGAEINPNKYEDSDHYYLSNGKILCKECFQKESEEYLETNTDDFAALVGASVVEVI